MLLGPRVLSMISVLALHLGQMTDPPNLGNARVRCLNRLEGLLSKLRWLGKRGVLVLPRMRCEGVGRGVGGPLLLLGLGLV